jgi:lysozyme
MNYAGACVIIGFQVVGAALGIRSAAALDAPAHVPTKPHIPEGIFLEPPESRAPIPPGLVMRPIYAKGLAFMKSHEGWSSTRYNDSAGFCTIGYGHLIKQSRCDGTEPAEFIHGLSPAQGWQLFLDDLRPAQFEVMSDVKVKMTDGEYAALCDFTFNVGTKNFRGSTLLQRVNENLLSDVPTQFRRWVLAGGNKKSAVGLLNRRNAEIAMFFDGQEVTRASPPPGEDTTPIDIQKGETH